jgi:hypothetical protein
MEIVRYEVLKAVVKKSYILCDRMQFIPLKVKFSEECVASIFRVQV